MRILIADPDDVFLEILQSYLKRNGHEAEIAADGLECMIVLRAFAPEVLVLEQELLWGGADGVLAEMSDNPKLAGIRTILISDNDPLEDESIITSNLPLAGWLRKPFRLSDLLERIESVIRSQRHAFALSGDE